MRSTPAGLKKLGKNIAGVLVTLAVLGLLVVFTR